MLPVRDHQTTAHLAMKQDLDHICRMEYATDFVEVGFLMIHLNVSHVILIVCNVKVHPKVNVLNAKKLHFLDLHLAVHVRDALEFVNNVSVIFPAAYPAKMVINIIPTQRHVLYLVKALK